MSILYWRKKPLTALLEEQGEPGEIYHLPIFLLIKLIVFKSRHVYISPILGF
jgi:hypothetical protein